MNEKPDPTMIQRVFTEATAMAIGMCIGGKAAVRRVVGTAAWRHDPERIAAAEAKRERRRQRAGGASS